MENKPILWQEATLFILTAAGCFHIAYTPVNSGLAGLFIIGYLVFVVQLARMQTARRAFYAGIAAGLLCFSPQLGFFWGIFGISAIPLWVVLAFWVGLFSALSQVALARFGSKYATLLIPFLWTGCEYFRSELYYLKFSWLNVGYALANSPFTPFHLLGVYGIAFVIAAIAALSLKTGILRIIPLYVCAVLICVFSIKPPAVTGAGDAGIHITGIQLEFPSEDEIIKALDGVVTRHSPVDLCVLSEYTLLNGPPSRQLKDWCRNHDQYLIIGGKDPTTGGAYFNTAFVIDPKGEIVFKQAKSVPIQLFKDGLPAFGQELWNSPWGKIGICICYDLSYTRVTDQLAKKGAQMLIVPTMDVAEWGRHEHELHARIAPVRAAEYGIPVFRVASSGISQGINGLEKVQTSFPGQGEVLDFQAVLSRPATVPLDRRFLVQISLGITTGWGLWIILELMQTAVLRSRKG